VTPGYLNAFEKPSLFQGGIHLDYLD